MFYEVIFLLFVLLLLFIIKKLGVFLKIKPTVNYVSFDFINYKKLLFLIIL